MKPKQSPQSEWKIPANHQNSSFSRIAINAPRFKVTKKNRLDFGHHMASAVSLSLSLFAKAAVVPWTLFQRSYKFEPAICFCAWSRAFPSHAKVPSFAAQTTFPLRLSETRKWRALGGFCGAVWRAGDFPLGLVGGIFRYAQVVDFWPIAVNLPFLRAVISLGREVEGSSFRRLRARIPEDQ